MSDSTITEHPTRSEVYWSRVSPYNRRNKLECAEWAGSKLPSGYGTVKDPVTGRDVYAHRLAKMLELGRDLHEGEIVRHACNNPSCVRRSHLVVGTYSDNMADRKKAGRVRVMPALSNDDVRAIRHAFKTRRFTQHELSEIFFGTPAGQPKINSIVQGKTYRHAGGPLTKLGRGNRAKRRRA
jgi:hypothetical protein